MGGITKYFDRWFGRSANLFTFWPLFPAGIVGVVTGYLAMGMNWINQFGAFGWWSAGLLGFLIASFVLALAAYSREKFALAAAVKKWSKDVDAINPLDKEFIRKRIKISDLAHPVKNTIEGKRFVDCELVGPGTILAYKNNNLSKLTLLGCDLVPVKIGGKSILATRLIDVEIMGGTMINLTMYIPPSDVDQLVQFGGADFVALTGRPEIDGVADGGK